MAKESFSGGNTTTSGSNPTERSEFSFYLSKPKTEEGPAAATETLTAPPPDAAIARVTPELAQVRQQYSFFEKGLVEARGIKDPDKRMTAIANSLAILDELRQQRGVLDGSIKSFDGFKQDQEVRYQLPDGKFAVARMVAKQDYRLNTDTGQRIDSPNDPLIILETFDRSKPDPADWVPVRVAVLASKLREVDAAPKVEATPEKPAEEKVEAPEENKYEQAVRDADEEYKEAEAEYNRDLLARVRQEFRDYFNSPEAEDEVLKLAREGKKLGIFDQLVAKIVLLRRAAGKLSAQQRAVIEAEVQAKLSDDGLDDLVIRSGKYLNTRTEELTEGRLTLSKSVPGQGGVYENLGNRKLAVLLDAEQKLTKAVQRRNAETEAQRARGKFRVVGKDADRESSNGNRPISQAV